VVGAAVGLAVGQESQETGHSSETRVPSSIVTPHQSAVRSAVFEEFAVSHAQVLVVKLPLYSYVPKSYELESVQAKALGMRANARSGAFMNIILSPTR